MPGASAIGFNDLRQPYGFGGVELAPGAGALTGGVGELAPADGTMFAGVLPPGGGATVAGKGEFAVGNVLPAGCEFIPGCRGVIVPPGGLPKDWLSRPGGLVIE